MNKSKVKQEKSIEQYRRDIFTLKKQLKDQQQTLQSLKHQYQNAEVLGDTSYTYSMKLKILQYTLNDIRAKLRKFSGQEQYEYYSLNFSTLALMKSCQVVGLTREMIFRGVDVQRKGLVGSFQFSSFLKDVMHSQFINPIMKVLCPDESQPVTKKRYQQYIDSFMIQSQQNGEETDNLQEPINRIANQLYKQSILPQKIWKTKQINIAITVHGLMKSAKNLDILDCVACYCKCDPLKTGMINTSGLVNLLQHKMDDGVNYQAGAIKFKLAKI